MSAAEKLPVNPAEAITRALSLLGQSKCSVNEMRAKIMGLEAAMLSMADHKTANDFDTRHHFSPGVYMRELHIPAGTVITGKIHSTEHMNILSQGSITVYTENGMKHFTASTVIPSKPGIKRVGLAHTDCVWITVHQNPENLSLSELEEKLFHDDFESAYLCSDKSFETAISFLGLSPFEVEMASQNTDDQSPVSLESFGVTVSHSKIHGKGIFASRVFASGDLIAPARVNGLRTQAGRFTNHSGSPNASMTMDDRGDVFLVASRAIESGEEILNDYYLSFTRTRTGIQGGVQLCQP